MRTTLPVVCALATLAAVSLFGQTDPGPRSGPPLSGQALNAISGSELAIFQQSQDAFNEVEDVAKGLGPRFNMDSCGGCHAQPTIGGSSPAINPQIAVATKNGAMNTIPPFIRADGPIRVVRFRRGPDGRPDGGVHDLFVITGRGDAPSTCQIQQPDFGSPQNPGPPQNPGGPPQNLTFRIPTPVFGLGLVESIPDATLIANLTANADRKRQLDIQGRFNTSGNDGTITRFGWKAQNKSLTVFAGEAYNVEIGVSNEVFPQEREGDPSCASTTAPEDHVDLESGGYSDTMRFALFMRYLAPPTPGQSNPSIERGRAGFDAVGCTLCHTPTLTNGKSYSAALSNQDVNLYSDLAIHRMGRDLDDGITQGQAQGQDWRTALLWGLGDRIFFLHDGRTKDLLDAIRIHDSPGSEAHNVIMNFGALPDDQKQDIVNFLRSL
ncbi:MAG TPA: di-heme oxidoredictase family protein [Bryobacteraceae bacterium]|nr:di-heme oxidoredictase family protein [Bryobacteraceae bacterium]